MYRLFEGEQHARAYARFRPDPPAALVRRVLDFVGRSASLERAVDVGCGTGQNTRLLAPHFGSVLGTDISAAQVAAAVASSTCDSVRYEVAAAEEIPAPDSSVQLITASMCYHFFDKPRFLAEADRVLVPGGVVAIYGYKELSFRMEGGSIWTELDDIIDKTAEVHLKDYWQLPVQVKGLMEITKEALQLIQYPNAVWDEEGYFEERPLSVECVLGEMRSWSGFQNLVANCGTEKGDALLQQVRGELLTELAEGKKRGINTDAVTMRRAFYLLMARKPAQVTASE